MRIYFGFAQVSSSSLSQATARNKGYGSGMQELMILLPVETGSLWLFKKSVFRDPRGRVRSGGEIYLSGNIRLPPGSQCLISSSPAVEKAQPCFHLAQK